MANKNFKNKNSQYIQSLVDFVLDTKPYHSKINDVVEEFQFSDTVNVKVVERFNLQTKLAAAWKYNYFSGANPSFRTMPARRLVSPTFSRTSHIVGADENTDMASVPFVYSKKAFTGVGVNAVFTRNANGVAEPLTESVDFFQSHGSFQFQIKQTLDANSVFNPLWASTMDDGAIAIATNQTIANALDLTNPQSEVNQIRAILDSIQVIINGVSPFPSEVNDELVLLYAILDLPDLPQSYEALLAQIDANTLLTSIDTTELKQQFENLSPPLYFMQFSDLGVRENGKLSYENIGNSSISISNITPVLTADYEEWTLTAVDDNTPQYSVVGSSSGFIGFITAGETFISIGKISFATQSLGQPVIGETISFAPTNKISIRNGTPLETCNIIKVNPIAHDAPVLTSSHYGSIQDLDGTSGKISLLSAEIPTTTLILIARADGVTFDLTSTADPLYVGVAQADVTFNDGIVGFTIISGTIGFTAGDKFYIPIENLPASARNLDLGFGYDLDAYDNGNLVYNNTDSLHPDYNRKIDFNYDGRFVDYDVNDLGITISQAAVNGKTWRIRAIPSSTLIATLKKDGSGPNNSVDLTDATSGISPDPASNSAPLFSMAGDTNAAPDLLLSYALSFRVEYLNESTLTYIGIGSVNVGDTFTSALHGISFTLPAGSKPFIAVSADDGLIQPPVEGGDVFSFTVSNPFPTLLQDPIGITSSTVPRLIMHSNSFFDAPAANWAITFTSSTSYEVTAIQTGDNNGIQLPGTPVTGYIPIDGVYSRENFSFKGLGIHFTIVPNRGIFAGDTFTFETFEDKPTYLVHGSVTGWMAPATIGKYYWNGHIGFKLNAPEIELFNDGVATTPGDENITISRLREDTPSIEYLITRGSLSASSFTVTRTDVGVVGFVSSTGTFEDKYITFTLNAPTFLELVVMVSAHDYTQFNAQDTVILNPAISAKLPLTNDNVLIEKTESGRLGISITPSVTDISALKPITIDQRFIDLNTNSVIPLANTSPETSILSGWLPFTVESFDSDTSIAEFSDPATRYVFTSAGTGLPIGTLKQQGSDLNEPIIFEWDVDFFNTYLPLNAEANLVSYGTGLNEDVNVNMAESIKFLISGGALLEDWMFNDVVSINFTEDNLFRLTNNYYGSFGVNVDDGPFGGFLSGYDNQGFDNELNGYDEGSPPDIYSLLSKYGLTAQEEADIISRWNFFLVNGDQIPTSEAQWAFLRAMITSDIAPGIITDGFGYPAIGLGFDITEEPTTESATSFQEAMVILAADQANLHDEHGFDTRLLDAQDETTAIFYSGALPPIPVAGVPVGATFETFETPLTIDLPSRVFEVSFNASSSVLLALTPSFSIWLPSQPSPQHVAVVEQISLGTYRFSIPSASPAKIIVG